MIGLLALLAIVLWVKVLMLRDLTEFQDKRIDWLESELQRLDADIEALYDEDGPDPDDGAPVEDEPSNVVAFRKAS